MKLASLLRKKILTFQENELSEYFIYQKLATVSKQKNNREVLKRIANQELAHYNFWKSLSGEEIKPNQGKIIFYGLLGRFFGLNFAVRLMEKGENLSQNSYQTLGDFHPKIKKIIAEEEEHENLLLSLLDKSELAYTSSIVLGLNDALVELTGALAGFTLALQNQKIVAIAGLITGIAASLSMASSEYLSTKEEGEKNPLKASVLTGLAYFATVVILIAPYFILENSLISLLLVIFFSLVIIFLFNFYIAVAKNISFKERFLKMSIISLGVACLNYLIGFGVRRYFKIEI